MLQELAGCSDAAAWAIGSMLFFLAAFVAVVAWVALRRSDEMEARARMPLEQDSGIGSQESEIGDQGSGGPTTPNPDS
jgi:hypothetical protein